MCTISGCSIVHRREACCITCHLFSQLQLHESVVLFLDDESSDIASVKDNRELLDSRENQLLSKDEIHSLRVKGFTGEASCCCLSFIEMLHYILINQYHHKCRHTVSQMLFYREVPLSSQLTEAHCKQFTVRTCWW